LEILDEWNNIFDIISKNTDNKNKVSFNPTATKYTYGIGDNHNRKSKSKTKSIRIFSFEKNDYFELTTEQKIAIYLKIIFMNETYVDNLKYIIKSMCKVLNDINIDYDICNPYKKCLLYKN
jgi:hypothetical protein